MRRIVRNHAVAIPVAALAVLSVLAVQLFNVVAMNTVRLAPTGDVAVTSAPSE